MFTTKQRYARQVHSSCRRALLLTGLLVLQGIPCAAQNANGTGSSTSNVGSSEPIVWIWTPEHVQGSVPQSTCYFRKTLHLAEKPQSGIVEIAADDIYELYVNAKRIGRGSAQKELNRHTVTTALRKGKNVIAIKVTNRNGSYAGVAARITVDKGIRSYRVYTTNPTWRCNLAALPLWNSNAYADDRWRAAKNIGTFGRTAPWSEAPADDELLAAVPRPNIPTLATKSKKESLSPAMIDEEHPRFRLPAGFEVQHVVGHEATGSLIGMAFNEFGQVLVSQEGGPLLLVYDTNDNGTPDEVRVCCERVKNCQGILAISGKVYVIADGPVGAALYCLTDENHDGEYETVDALVRFKDPIGEHGPHGLALGPDAMIYIVVGNHTRLKGSYELSSPLRDYYEGDLHTPKYEDPRGHASGIEAPGGAILRTDLHGRRVELYAGGLRNAYDLAFNRRGELFVHDSDMESDSGTPWHRPTRLLHAIPGSEFGWRSGASKWPDYYIDSLPSILDTGRGSPTGCVVYDHMAYPKRYRHALFSCDWAQGEIYAMRMEPKGCTYTARREVFLQGRPLNVTDIDVGPDGWVYFTTGGRGTRGNLYRVAYTGKLDKEPTWKGVAKALRQPQAQSAWGRQQISSARQMHESSWSDQISNFVFSRKVKPEYRAQALGIMHLVGPPPSDVQLIELSKDSSPLVRTKAAYLLGMISNANSIEALKNLLNDSSATVRRTTCESLARIGHPVAFDSLAKILMSENRLEAWAARRLLQINSDPLWRGQVLDTSRIGLFVQGSLAMLITSPDSEMARQIAVRATELSQGFVPPGDMLSLIRVVQLAYLRGDLPARAVPEVDKWVSKQFPSDDDNVNRELVRLAVRTQQSKMLQKIISYLNSDIPDVDKLHIVTELRFMKSGWTAEQQKEVILAFEEAQRFNGGKNVKQYIDKYARDFCKTLGLDAHKLILAEADKMPDMALHTMYALQPERDEEVIPGLIALDRRLANDKDDRLEDLKIGIVAILARHGSEFSMGYLREVYDRDPPRRKVVAMGLAQKPGGRNWDYLVRSIPLLDGDPALEVLTKLQIIDFAPEEMEHYRQVILAGLRLKDKGGLEASRLLEHWEQETPPGIGDRWDTAMSAWQRWFEHQNPGRPTATLPKESGNNTWTFNDLLAFLDSEQGQKGDAVKGAAVFAKAECAACHVCGDQGKSLGPDLTTVANRFQKSEILESIVHPSQVISDQYASSVILTEDGGTITGMVMPGGRDELVVLQSDGTTVKVKMSEIEEREPSRTSSMPEGLLNSLSLDEVADLFAYLMQTRSAEVAGQQPATNRVKKR